jgi:hypothetical protein
MTPIAYMLFYRVKVFVCQRSCQERGKGMVVLACNSTTWETEARGLQVQCEPRVHNKTLPQRSKKTSQNKTKNPTEWRYFQIKHPMRHLSIICKEILKLSKKGQNKSVKNARSIWIHSCLKDICKCSVNMKRCPWPWVFRNRQIKPSETPLHTHQQGWEWNARHAKRWQRCGVVISHRNIKWCSDFRKQFDAPQTGKHSTAMWPTCGFLSYGPMINENM